MCGWHLYSSIRINGFQQHVGENANDEILKKYLRCGQHFVCQRGLNFVFVRGLAFKTFIEQGMLRYSSWCPARRRPWVETHFLKFLAYAIGLWPRFRHTVFFLNVFFPWCLV